MYMKTNRIITGLVAVAGITLCGLQTGCGMEAENDSVSSESKMLTGWQYIWRHIGSGSDRRYLDVQWGGNTNGTPVWTWPYNGGSAQQWNHYPENGALMNANGLCLDVQWSGTANGTPVQLWECNNSGAQQWVHVNNMAFLNPNSGRCLDVPNDTADAVQLQIWDCNGTNAQFWEKNAM
jgi:hypothetical protein